jgi:hypothetical protein
LLAAKFKAQGQKFVAAKEKIGSWQTTSAERTGIISMKKWRAKLPRIMVNVSP